jgi:16S rRNA (guanine527-N7)-methyltransferase
MRQEADPSAVAQTVRTLVERELNALRFVPAALAFLARIEKFAEELARWGARMNLTAHPDDPQEVAFHMIDSLMPAVLAVVHGMLKTERDDTLSPLAGVFDSGKRVLDLGSGAGFPGLVLAAATAAHFTLVESRRKRSSFLRVVAAEAGLSNVTVEAQPSQALSLARNFDIVTARAFGEPAAVYEFAARALSPGGVALLYASASQRLALDAAHKQGLSAYTRIDYQVVRGDTKVARVLALWRKS